MSDSAIRCIVEGRVQGVFYRASTQDKATELGLTGWARNLHNGNVEVVAVGDSRAVAELAEWLWEASPASKVVRLSIEEWSGESPKEFSIA